MLKITASGLDPSCRIIKLEGHGSASVRSTSPPSKAPAVAVLPDARRRSTGKKCHQIGESGCQSRSTSAALPHGRTMLRPTGLPAFCLAVD
jgi:hypothetical protein